MTTPFHIRLNQMEQDIKDVKETMKKVELEHIKMREVLERYTVLTKQTNDTMNFLLMAIQGGRKDDNES